MSPNKIMPSWEEWNELKPEQREYSLYRTLASIDQRLIEGDQRFKALENRKVFDKVTAFFGGVLGGLIAVLGKTLYR